MALFDEILGLNKQGVNPILQFGETLKRFDRINEMLGARSNVQPPDPSITSVRQRFDELDKRTIQQLRELFAEYRDDTTKELTLEAFQDLPISIEDEDVLTFISRHLK